VVEGLDKAAALVGGLPKVELRLTLDPSGIPIRSPYGWCLLRLARWGFTTWDEVESVVGERRLLNEWLSPIPLVFDVGEGCC